MSTWILRNYTDTQKNDSIEYKKATLSITINTDNRNLTPNQPNKVFNKEIKNVSISKLEEMLETLLVETEEQHKLLKNKEL